MNVGDLPLTTLLDTEELEWYEVVHDAVAVCTIVEYVQAGGPTPTMRVFWCSRRRRCRWSWR